jgi:pyridoxamine 5'-phosphate oxidase
MDQLLPEQVVLGVHSAHIADISEPAGATIETPMTDPATLRQTYLRGQLDEADVASTWHEQLGAWFAAAVADPEVLEPNAIQVATVDGTGRPSVRTVLAKRIDERGIVFYTNYDSAKARDLSADRRAAAVFVWLAHHRQVRLSGTVAKVSRQETEAYFATRPRESQLGAWVSPQSQVIESRAALDALTAEVEERFDAEPVPAPPYWGGYLLAPESVEFWQGRVGRLHDRIRFRRDDTTWVRERLAP